MAQHTGETIAKPSHTCCLGGHIHEGEPRESFTTIASIETYIARPPDNIANGHILLYFPDIHGFFKNGFLVMDAFADTGFLTIGLDYFRGDPIWKHRKAPKDTATEPDFDFEAWKTKHLEFSDDAVPRWINEVKAAYAKADTKVACVGYCYGAPYVCNELAKGGSCIAGPLFLSCSETDYTFPNDALNRAVGLMQGESKTFQLQLFSSVEHGFALRGNPSDPYEKYVKEQSLKGIVEWLNFWLSQKA